MRRIARFNRRFVRCSLRAIRAPILLLVIVVIGAPPRSLKATDPPIEFSRDIAPLLEKHCLKCHSDNVHKGNFSLSTGKHLADHEYVVAGDPDASYLVEMISGDKPKMPKKGDPLSKDQVARIRKWILDGAKWPAGVVLREKSKADKSWWAIQPLERADPPFQAAIANGWAANPIDRFVAAKLSQNGLKPNGPADRRTLIRRATYDLTGLPPTPEEVDGFVNDPDPLAYEKLIDRLLASPRYGERWGRHWLDVVRFGESNGFERNVIIEDLWPFRDYVIRSFNADKPFDRLVREHLAGDVISPGKRDVHIGSAFLVCGPYDNVGNSDPVQAAQIRANTIDEMIRATGAAFLGLTIGCARCHDHKFDPILQRDYYQLYATFAAVRHGSRVVATADQKAAHEAKVEPLRKRRDALTKQRDSLLAAVNKRAEERAAEHEKTWHRPPTNLRGVEETVSPVEVRFVRLVSEGESNDPENVTRFAIEEFEVWSAESQPRNVALAAGGAKAHGESRQIEDFPGAYGPHLAIDGKSGARFLATAGTLTIELARPTPINRVFFASLRGNQVESGYAIGHLADYRIEASSDGNTWKVIAHGRDRKPVNTAHRRKRLREMEITEQERMEVARLNRQIGEVGQQIEALPKLQTAWVGERVASDAKGPFHVFVGGSPQRKGEVVGAASPSALDGVTRGYRLGPSSGEAERRQALADWLADPQNPLTSRVLVNRLWHYHFGAGLVSTPNDFGFMGGEPSHPQLLDRLAQRLLECDWRVKPLHRMIMTSQTYRQSSRYRSDAARVDGDARLLWRFPPRRLSAEEIRDTLLSVSGVLDTTMGGPGFRLYRYLEDNVATYVPLDKHGPLTYRRAVYHQNARASRTDLMTDFDQPDCAFSTARRVQTTTPLQALTMLNHQFTLDMSHLMAQRLKKETDVPATQVERIFTLCYGRRPSQEETAECVQLIQQHSLTALCRVMLNTSELIYVR